MKEQDIKIDGKTVYCFRFSPVYSKGSVEKAYKAMEGRFVVCISKPRIHFYVEPADGRPLPVLPEVGMIHMAHASELELVTEVLL